MSILHRSRFCWICCFWRAPSDIWFTCLHRYCFKQCSRSGAASGSVCFWASWIPIRIHNLWIFHICTDPDPSPAPDPDPSINKQKNEVKSWFLLFSDFFMTFYLWRITYVNVPLKRINHKINDYFLLASWRSTDEKSRTRKNLNMFRWRMLWPRREGVPRSWHSGLRHSAGTPKNAGKSDIRKGRH